MADQVLIGPVAASGQRAEQPGRVSWRPGGRTFHQVLATSLRAPRTAGAAGAQPAVLRATPPARRENPVSMIPPQTDAALQQAMALEGVPDAWQSGLRFIMAQESGGRVDAENPVHSARGLFQLTAVHYRLNPNGVRSFGNAVEEAQGGIRYIRQRYGTADQAVAFWRQHHWY